MKKIIYFLLVLLMIISSALPSFVVKSVEFSASSSEVFAGDEFAVDIFISDYSQLQSAILYVEYDEKTMKFLDLNVGAIVTAGSNAVTYKNISNSGNSYVQIEYKDSSGSLSTAGKFISLTFVASDTAVGETEIKLSANSNQISTATESVTPIFDNGKVNIINKDPVVTEKISAEPEESSSDAPYDSDTTSSTESATQNSTEGASKNENSGSAITDDVNKEDVDKEKSKNYLIIAVAVILVIVIAIVIVINSNNAGKSMKRKTKNK